MDTRGASEERGEAHALKPRARIWETRPRQLETESLVKRHSQKSQNKDKSRQICMYNPGQVRIPTVCLEILFSTATFAVFLNGQQ